MRKGSMALMIVQSHEEKVTPLFHVHTSKDKGKTLKRKETKQNKKFREMHASLSNWCIY